MRTRNPDLTKPYRQAVGSASAIRSGGRGVRIIDRTGRVIEPVTTLRVPWAQELEEEEAELGSEVGTVFENAHSDTLNVGDVVVIVGETVTVTTTPQDTRPVGVVVVAGEAGEDVVVQTSGVVAYVRVTAAITANNYAETSTTAGAATESVTRREGSFGRFLTDGTEPSAILFGIPDAPAAEVSSDLYLTNSTGELHVPGTITAGATQTLDLSTANTFDVTLTANCTISLSNPPDSGVEGRWTIALRQDATGSRTVTWPAAVSWRSANGTQTATAPTLATAANAMDVVDLRTLDGGATYGASLENGTDGLVAEEGGHYEVLMTGASPAEPLENGSGTDWLYVWVT